MIRSVIFHFSTFYLDSSDFCEEPNIDCENDSISSVSFVDSPMLQPQEDCNEVLQNKSVENNDDSDDDADEEIGETSSTPDSSKGLTNNSHETPLVRLQRSFYNMSAKRRRIRTRGGVPTRGGVRTGGGGVRTGGGGVRTRGGARRVKPHAREQESWNDDPRGERRFTFTGNPGVNTFPEDPEDVIDVFKTFLSDEIIDTFVEYTNLYADTIINTPAIQEKNKRMFGKWSAVDRDEMWMYITLTLMMRIFTG